MMENIPCFVHLGYTVIDSISQAPLSHPNTNRQKRMSEQEPTLLDPEPRPAPPPSRTRNWKLWNVLLPILGTGCLIASLFTFLTPSNVFSNEMIDQLFRAWQAESLPAYPSPTPLPAPRIGIVAGHYGSDSGATCPDGLTEVQVNLSIASRVHQKLTEQGYQVDLLQEFDPRLSGYRALALISIHNDTCDVLGPEFTGFKVAAAASSAYPEKATRLRECMVQRYQAITGLPFHPSTITNDMTNYHTFNEIHTDTTAAIIETGFLGSGTDRALLTQNPDLIADGVVAGILCYVRNESLTPTAQPTTAP